MTLIVANWKMYQSYEQAIAFVCDHLDELEELGKSPYQLVIAPSFVCLDPLWQMLKMSRVTLCAQDCAPFRSGAYTGEVDAASLAQVGCYYGLVGHSERRRYFGETNEMMAQKIALLFENSITPIICIGETQDDYSSGRTRKVIEAQLAPFIEMLENQSESFVIAYEPEWAIGTGITPHPDELTNIYSWIYERASKNGNCSFLYGGSVTEENVAQIMEVPRVGGLLIGKASCDFQSLKKIVSLA